MVEADAGASPTLEERLARLEEKLDRLAQGRPEQSTAYWAIVESVLPSDARRHLRAAGREQLLAARSIIDNWVKRMDAGQDEPSRERRETIRVE